MTLSSRAHLLVDRDGTLLDTCAANMAAYEAAFADHGLDFGPRESQAVADGRDWKAFFPVDLMADLDLAMTVRGAKEQHLADLVGDVRLNPSVLRLLESRDGPHALVTTASAQSTQMLLAQFGLSILFQEVITGDDVVSPKPAPDAYLVAISRLGVVPGRALAIEDSDVGEASARAAGLAVLRIPHFCTLPSCARAR